MPDTLAVGIDYSYTQVSAEAAARAGVKFVIRYFAGSARMTRVEVDNLHAQNIAVLGVVEQEADEAEKGFARGVQLATVGNDEADAIGYPADVPLLYADDNNDPDPDQEVETMRGVKSVGRRVSDMYSGGNILVALARAGLSPFGGWMVETWFPHDGADPFAVQLANTRDPIHIPGIPDEQFDTDLLLKPIPMWGPNGVVMLGGTTPSIKSKEDDNMVMLVSTDPGKSPAFQVYFDPALGKVVKSPIEVDELDTLPTEIFAGLYRVNTDGRPFPAQQKDLDGWDTVG